MKITNEDNMQLMARYENNYFDLAIVDPPYGINIDDWDSEIPTKECHFLQKQQIQLKQKLLLLEFLLKNKIKKEHLENYIKHSFKLYN